jgi:hypothetical protein
MEIRRVVNSLVADATHRDADVQENNSHGTGNKKLLVALNTTFDELQQHINRKLVPAPNTESHRSLVDSCRTVERKTNTILRGDIVIQEVVGQTTESLTKPDVGIVVRLGRVDEESNLTCQQIKVSILPSTFVDYAKMRRRRKRRNNIPYNVKIGSWDRIGIAETRHGT